MGVLGAPPDRPAIVTSQRQRLILLALNAELGLRRESVCRLAQRLEEWTRPGTRAGPALAAQLGTSLQELRKALAVLPGAEAFGRMELARARRAGARILVRDDPDYPSALERIELPPPVLYCQGETVWRTGVAIVGSRRADPYGIEAAEHFAAAVSEAGLTVVSGLAMGIDSAAHRAALTTGPGGTIAVLGCGIDRCYPTRSRRLRRQIEARGTVVSEFPLGCDPLPQNFPIRNRIIAALGVACLVVQAARRSGSLITARLALEQGRDVWAVPGRIFDPRCRGTNELIRDGAFPALDPDDMLAWLPGADGPGSDEPTDRETPAGSRARLLDSMLPGEPVSADDLAELLHAPVREVLSQLLELEMVGRVRRCAGGKYARRAGDAGSRG